MRIELIPSVWETDVLTDTPYLHHCHLNNEQDSSERVLTTLLCQFIHLSTIRNYTTLKHDLPFGTSS